MTEASGAETGGNAVFDLARDLTRVSSTPGWKAIKESAFSEAGDERSVTAHLRRGVRLLRPVTAQVVEKGLADNGTKERELQEAWITHTVGFAKNVLEAESAAHFRATIQGLDIADISPTGEHAVFKSQAKQSGKNSDEAKKAAQKIIEGRTKLPVAKPDGIRLQRPDLAVFYGMAELYGMARAGYDPGRLTDYLAGSGVISVCTRTENLLANHGKILETLYQESPQETLASLGVSMPGAIELADSPSANNIMAIARQAVPEA